MLFADGLRQHEGHVGWDGSYPERALEDITEQPVLHDCARRTSGRDLSIAENSHMISKGSREVQVVQHGDHAATA